MTVASISTAPCINPTKKDENEAHFKNHLQEKSFHCAWLSQILDETASKLSEKFPFQINEKGVSVISVEKNFVPVKQPQFFPSGDGRNPLFLINIPMGVRPHEPLGKKAGDLLRKLETESFSTDSEHSQVEAYKKLAVVLGINQMKSIDERVNRAFRNRVGDFVSSSEVPYRIEGFFWEPQWKMTRESAVSKESAYLLLRYLNGGKANAVREELEGGEIMSKALCSQIPYSKIRERIKQSSSTETFATKLQEFRNSPLYFMTMDDDPVRLYSITKGCLSHYEDVIANTWKEKGFFPSVLSLGYQLRSRALPIPRIAVECDMYVREAMNRIIPGSAYMPEPCTAYYFSNSDGFLSNLKKLSFLGDGNNLESKRAISNGIREKILQNERIVFTAIPSLVTKMPARMAECSATCRKYESLSSTDLQKEEVLKALRGVPQVHFFHLNWAHSLYERIPVECKKGRGVFQKLSGKLTKVFTVFDPITFADAMPFKDAFAIYKPAIQELINSQPSSKSQFSSEAWGFIEVQRAKLDEAKEDLKALNMSDEWINKIVLAAQASGEALFDVLSYYAFE